MTITNEEHKMLLEAHGPADTALKTGGAPRVANAPAPVEQSQETKTEQERRISENERWMREYLDEAKEKQ